MTDDEKFTLKRLKELYDRAESRYYNTYSDFLTLAEQALLPQAAPPGGYTLFGGYDSAERCLACFGEDAAQEAPVVCLCIEPVNEKFADELSHRDFLGSLMNLGLRRETMGDILLSGRRAYLFCLPAAAETVLRELTRVKRTTVKVSRVDAPPEYALPHPAERVCVVSSERLDAITAAVYDLSRAESQKLFPLGQVFVNSRTCTRSDFILTEGDIVSVRGHGRFVYNGVARETKKGRLRVSVGVY